MTTSAPPAAASPAQLLYPDLAHELQTVRRTLERVPADRADWVPHEKSMPLGRLAAHLAELPQFGSVIVGTEEMDFAKGQYVPLPFESTEQVLAVFDERAAKMRAAVEGASWDELSKPWTLRSGDHVILSGPKSVLLRTLGLSHIVHHRAQLGVYLRLLGVAVPSTYGPSADEQA